MPSPKLTNSTKSKNKILVIAQLSNKSRLRLSMIVTRNFDDIFEEGDSSNYVMWFVFAPKGS